MDALQEVVNNTSLSELKKAPKNWRDVMEALIAGAVDYDDHQEVMGRASLAADEKVGGSQWQLGVLLAPQTWLDESEYALQLRALGAAADGCENWLQLAREAYGKTQKPAPRSGDH